jgi:phage gpG-like protein
MSTQVFTADVDAKGFEELRQAITELIDKAEDLSPFMRLVAALGESETRERFATETDPSGQKWLPSQRALATGTKTLTKDGHLGDSVNSQYGADWAAWGTNRPEYDWVHQGGFNDDVQIPAHVRRISQAFGKKIEPRDVQVNAHTRHMTIVERAFLPRNTSELERMDIGELKDYLVQK